MERDTAFFIGGAALAVLLFLFSIKIKDISASLFYCGMFISITIIMVAFGFIVRKNLSGPFILFLVGVLLIVSSSGWYYWKLKNAPSPEDVSATGSEIASNEALAQLTLLGWTVKPDIKMYKFEIANRSLPPMEESATYFTKLTKPFQLVLQQATNLSGLHYISDIPTCTKIEINAGEFTDISEIHDFKYLQSLVVGQVPLNGTGIVDASALASLPNLEELTLGMTRIRSIEFLKSMAKLKRLRIGKTLVSDLSALASLVDLEELDIRGAPAVDLRALSHLSSLTELEIAGNQVPSLTNLSSLQNLKQLRIIDQGNLDLSPVANLPSLTDLWIWGPTQIDLGPLRRMPNLRAFSLTGLGFNSFTIVKDAAAIGELKLLETLTLGPLLLTDLNFVSDLTHLKQVTLNQLPISSISPLSNLQSMQKLSLADIQVIDISPLLQIDSLTDLMTIRVPARSDMLIQLQRRGVNITSY